ncbi:MAG TPA: hypothetical protein VD965_11815 [Burkholderiales bacterium]|nr:hypothetical protein [Burkholderiales bacterium]
MRLAGTFFVVAALLLPAVHAAPPALQARSAVSPETVQLRSIGGWLKRHGADGYVGADVADAMGIARGEGQDALDAKQRGFRTADVLRIAQISADERRDFMLFMAQQDDGQVFFYLASVRDGLKKAFVSIPSRDLVVPLERAEAEANFRRELLYWEDRIAAR